MQMLVSPSNLVLRLGTSERWSRRLRAGAEEPARLKVHLKIGLVVEASLTWMDRPRDYCTSQNRSRGGGAFVVVILGRAAHGVYVGVNEYARRPQKRRHGRWIRREIST